MKKWMLVTLLIMAVVAVSSVSYAWFTYVQRKSMVKLTANEIEATLFLNDDILTTTIDLKGLSYISFEEEVILSDTSDGFNEAGLNYLVKINVSDQSPLIKTMIEFHSKYPELIILWIDEGLYDENFQEELDYLSYLKTIGMGSSTKEAFLESLSLHNEGVLNSIKTIELKPGSTYVLQLVMWLDYDSLITTDNYLENTYQLELLFHMINGKSEFNDE
jgi:hypothetical protein